MTDKNNKINDQKNKPKQSKKVTEQRTTFLRVMNLRTEKLIDRHLLIMQIADNPQNYEFTAKDIDKIYDLYLKMAKDFEEKFLEILQKEVKKIEYSVKFD